MVNLSRLANSGSLYEQLIGQVIAVESQPRLNLRTEQSEQTVYKGVLSDFSSRVSSLDTLLDKLQDPLRSPFSGRAASVPNDAGFRVATSDAATTGQHEVQVTQIARADARLSKQVASSSTDVASLFTDPGDPGADPPTADAPGERTFTISVAQSEGDPVELAIAYTPPEGATNEDVLAGLAAAISDASRAAVADGRLEEGTGASASVVRETSGTARLSVRSAATGYANRLQFTDPDGILAALEVDNTSVRSGTGGGAVYEVGGEADSGLDAAFTLDGLEIRRSTNTIDDALDGLTFTLETVTGAPETLTVGADTKGMRAEVDAFIKAYNGLATFLNDKSRIDGDTGARGPLSSDSAARGLRAGIRTDLSRAISGAGDFSRLADLGIETQRDGTLKITDAEQLGAALAAAPQAVGALFSGEDGIGARLTSRFEGMLGASGTIAQRKESADARIRRIGDQIARWDARLERRETTLRDQFAQLEALMTQAQSQQTQIASLFFF